MILYHGTTDLFLAKILQEGLKPRGAAKGNWQHTVTSNAETVYLSRCYALYFAMCARQNGDRSADASMAIFEIDTDRLDPAKLVPDEDALEQTARGHEPRKLRKASLKARTLFWRTQASTMGGTMAWLESLKALGTCGYRGEIPPSAFIRFATLTPKAAARMTIQAHDPVICVMNHLLMGNHHHAFHRWLFDDSVEGFAGIDRDGVDVWKA